MMYIIEELYPKLTICIDREDAVLGGASQSSECVAGRRDCAGAYRTIVPCELVIQIVRVIYFELISL